MVKTKNKNILQKFNLKDNEYYLIVGRLIPDNNSKLIIESFIESNTIKKLVVVGDVPYRDIYANEVKKIDSKKIIFTGYIKCQDHLTQLYKNCFGYIHGHEYGGTNPTLINALDLNCEILALETPFNKEMLENRNVIFFEKTIKSIINSIVLFEENYFKLKKSNYEYRIPNKYNWDFITNEYLKLFKKLTNSQNM